MDECSKYVTNDEGNVFAITSLPEVVKGALFSRYSRSSKGLRELLVTEFYDGASEKADKFYDRILDGYGDDSIAELGGAHLAMENISMIAAKVIEDCRVGGSPLEKSTRYVPFEKEPDLFYRDPVLVKSTFSEIYLQTCTGLFAVYRKLRPLLTSWVSNTATPIDLPFVTHRAAIKARVLDSLRGLLPASALTNVGLYGNGRFFEGLLHKLHSHPLPELQLLGKNIHIELEKVIPSFVRRGQPGHRHQLKMAEFARGLRTHISEVANLYIPPGQGKTSGCCYSQVQLVSHSENIEISLATALLFSSTDASMFEIQEQCRNCTPSELSDIIAAAAHGRSNRRHKSPRALEVVSFTFEIVADFGVYRDLQRHRLLTQERQKIDCAQGYFVPQDVIDAGHDGAYCTALERAKESHDKVAEVFPDHAQYMVPMAFNIRWYFHINLRALQWLAELRTSPSGHPTYRCIAQKMVRKVIEIAPLLAPLFQFVDYREYSLGRCREKPRR